MHVMKNGPESHMMLGDLFYRACLFVVLLISLSLLFLHLSLNKQHELLLPLLFAASIHVRSYECSSLAPRKLRNHVPIRGHVLSFPPFANGRGPEDPLTPKTILGRRKTCKGVAGR